MRDLIFRVRLWGATLAYACMLGVMVAPLFGAPYLPLYVLGAWLGLLVFAWLPSGWTRRK